MKTKMMLIAILSLDKDVNVVIDGNKINWLDDRPQPTHEQIKAKIKELEVEEVKSQIEKKATDFIKNQLSELDYDNEGEVALYATNEKSKWHDEAKALQQWVEAVYVKMYELEDGVDETNYTDIDLDKIEADYPVFDK